MFFRLIVAITSVIVPLTFYEMKWYNGTFSGFTGVFTLVLLAILPTFVLWRLNPTVSARVGALACWGLFLVFMIPFLSFNDKILTPFVAPDMHRLDSHRHVLEDSIWLAYCLAGVMLAFFIGKYLAQRGR